MIKLKVLTLRQPWATLVAEGIKKYEFRSWKTNYRGKVLIHAGTGIDKEDMKKYENMLLKETCFVRKIWYNIGVYKSLIWISK